MRADDWRARLLDVSLELSHLETDADRRAAWKQARTATRSRYRFWVRVLVLVALVLVLNIPFNFALDWLGRYMATPYLLRKAVQLVVYLIVPAMVLLWLHRRKFQHELRQHLIRKGMKVCVHCGYDLRAQAEPRCPECGRSFAEESRNAR